MAGPWEKYASQQHAAQNPGPWEKYKDAAPEALVTDGTSQAALEHFGNAATMGYLPHIQAVVEGLLPNPTKDVDAELAKKGFKVQGADQNYVQRRDANIARLNQEAADHPIASAAGTVGGVVAGGALMSPLAGERAATAAGRIIQGAKVGALMGAAQNPGDKEGELDPLQTDQRISNAKTGAVVGGALSAAIEAAPHVIKGIRAVGRKIGATISGAAQGDVDQYAARTDQINKMIKDAGGNMTEAADQARQETQSAIRSKRASLSGQIGKALNEAPKDPVADISPVIDQLEKVKGRLNPNLKSEALAQVQNTISKLHAEANAPAIAQFEAIKSKLDPETQAQAISKIADTIEKLKSGELQTGGKVSVQQLNEITDFLQDRAKSAYMKGGQIFQNPKESAQAAKGAAAVSRKMLNGLSPEIAQANNQLALLHGLEDRLNPNLIKPGGPDSALFAAGSGGNPRNAKILEKLSEVSGYPIAERAKDLSAARTFANPSFLPSDPTGKAVARQLVAAGIGHAVAGPAGYLAAGVASPAAVKLAINAANAASKLAPDVIGAAQRNPAIVQRVANALTPKAQAPGQPDQQPNLDPATLGIFRANPKLIDELKDGDLKVAINKQLGRSPDSPAKGEDKWAQTGISKLGIADKDMAARLMSDPKARKLLIQASDLTPGSRAMQKIQTQIKEGWGRK